jgi:hypothetical protein
MGVRKKVLVRTTSGNSVASWSVGSVSTISSGSVGSDCASVHIMRVSYLAISLTRCSPHLPRSGLFETDLSLAGVYCGRASVCRPSGIERICVASRWVSAALPCRQDEQDSPGGSERPSKGKAIRECWARVTLTSRMVSPPLGPPWPGHLPRAIACHRAQSKPSLQFPKRSCSVPLLP